MLDVLYTIIIIIIIIIMCKSPKKLKPSRNPWWIHLELQSVFCQVIPWNVFADAQARMTDQSHQDFWVNLLDMVHDLNQVAHLEN